VAARLRAGSVNVNEGYAATFGAVDAPMGGMGVSGLGRRHGPEGLRGFTEPQTISVERLLSLAPPPGLPRQAYATVMTHASRWLYLTPSRLWHSLTSLNAGPEPAPGSFGPAAAGPDRPGGQTGGVGRSLWSGRALFDDLRHAVSGSRPAAGPFVGPGSRQAGVPLAGARVLITGGGSGMGRLMALGAARRGAEMTVWDLSAERADAVAQEIVAQGGVAHVQVVDITDAAAVSQAAAVAGGIDVLIHSAGVVGGRRLVDESAEAINRTIDVNLKALFWVTKAFLPGMVERHHGYVVTMASAAGLLAGAKMADYAASKAGAIGFTESLRNELRLDQAGVGALLVAPYYVRTGMFEGVRTKVPWLLPLLDPSDVAEKVLDGVEHGRRPMALPPFTYAIYLLRLAPIGWLDPVADLFGINASMDDFTGRDSDRV
jgi:all-trans-retinol dehydrogenase (NAD+)